MAKLFKNIPQAWARGKEFATKFVGLLCCWPAKLSLRNLRWQLALYCRMSSSTGFSSELSLAADVHHYAVR
jgi:hypothetical protein